MNLKSQRVVGAKDGASSIIQTLTRPEAPYKERTNDIPKH